MELDFFEEVSIFASLPSPSSNIEAWPYGTSLRFASLLHLGHQGYVNIADYVIIIIWDEICQKWDEICFNVKKWDEICQNFHVGRNLFGTKSVTPLQRNSRNTAI